MDTALFSPSSLFVGDGDDDDEGKSSMCPSPLKSRRLRMVERELSTIDRLLTPFVFAARREGEGEDDVSQQLAFAERSHAFPGGMELKVREFSFHQHNANLLWPGTFAFSEWLVQNQALLRGRRILELGRDDIYHRILKGWFKGINIGTGALAIFLRRSYGVDITTSDFDDKEVEENIAYNCRANALAVLPHIRHTWGEMFPTSEPDWDLVIASDILLYVKQYSNLIRTLHFLLNSYKPKDKGTGTESSDRPVTMVGGNEVQLHWPVFLMSWRRRIGREEEALFFTGCEDAGLVAEHVGARVYCISSRRG